MDDQIQITVWEGDYGLMSIDSDCLQIILYVQVTGAPVNFKSGRNPTLSHDNYPTLTCADIKLTNLNDIVCYLRQRYYNLDYYLSPKQCSESYALRNMIAQNMKTVMQYIWWVDPKNYEELTFAWYCQKMPVPFNRIYPHFCRKTAKYLIDETLGGPEDDPDVIKRYVCSTAAQMFTILSLRLGKDEYFYDDSPSSLDVTVYAFLAPIVYVPFPSNEIGELLNAWPSLTDFVKRINREFFPNCQPESKCVPPRIVTTRADDNNLKVSTGGILFAVMVVGLFVGGFVLSSNLNDIVKVHWMLLTSKC